VKKIKEMKDPSQKIIETKRWMINRRVDTKEAHPKHHLAALDLETGHENTAQNEVIQETESEADQGKEDEVVQEINVGVAAQEDVRETEIEGDLLKDIQNHPEGHRKETIESPQEHQDQRSQLNAKNCSKNGGKIIARHPSKSAKNFWNLQMRKSKFLGFDRHPLTFTTVE
jgi:hypothetical protein